MANKKYSLEDFFWKALFISGSLWLLSNLGRQLKKAAISGLPGALRKMTPYYSKEGKRVFYLMMEKLSPDERSELILAIRESRLKNINSPMFEILTKRKIKWEFKYNQWRIFLNKINESEFLMLHFYKKKTYHTDEKELQIAEQRWQEWQSWH